MTVELVAFVLLVMFFLIIALVKGSSIKKLNILDVLSDHNLQKFNIIYNNNYNKIDYNNANRDIRHYIWYNVVKKFKNKLHWLERDDFKQLKKFLNDKSSFTQVLLDKYGNILNIPIEIQKLVS